MDIITGEIQHLDQLADLFNSYRIFYLQQSDPDGARKFLNERIIRKESVIYMASLNATPCGFVQLYPIFSSVQMKKLWLLNDLFVHAGFRRQGVASALIRRSFKLAADTDACGILLETSKINQQAIALYDKEGFDLVENRFYYKNILKV